MPIKDSASLSEYRNFLKEELDTCFTRNHDGDPKKRFARTGIAREIFEEHKLNELFTLVSSDTNNDAARIDATDLTCIIEKIRGHEGLPSYCNVLATLLYSRCADATLWGLSQTMLGKASDVSVSDRGDDDLPLDEHAAREAFGNADGYQFWEAQFLFCPVILKENDESRYVGNEASCPMPFLEEPKEIGRGGYAIVYKVTIEKGHLINEREKSSYEVRLSLYDTSLFSLTGAAEERLRAKKIPWIRSKGRAGLRGRKSYRYSIHPNS